jgi:hypothetical protein
VTVTKRKHDNDIVLQDHTADRWRWLIDPINGYSVSGTYHFLTMAEPSLDRGMIVDVWQKQVPLKVNLFAWRLIRNRLPTKDNLVLRRVLLQDDNIWVRGCVSLDPAEHLFLGCDRYLCPSVVLSLAMDVCILRRSGYSS